MSAADYEKIYDYFRNVQDTPSPQDLAPFEPIRRVKDTVTMGRPLEPWGHTRFHKFLAIHMHNATRLAGDNDGLVDDVETAQKWDLAAMVQ